MAESSKIYTTQLQAGLGLLNETRLLLTLYQPGMTVSQLYDMALLSGLFPMVTARRLRNIIAECFAPRYMKTGAASLLKPLAVHMQTSTLNQLLLVYTAEANAILNDFIRDVYWERYSSGRNTLSIEDAKDFVTHAVREGKTQQIWADSSIRRVSSYLVGCCADYGLLSSNRSSTRSINPMHIHEWTVLYLAYKLHFDGLGDNAVINNDTWTLFGLNASDVRDELKRLTKNGWLILQSIGEVSRVSWKYSNMEDVINVITQS
jgi:hypothetical protein